MAERYVWRLDPWQDSCQATFNHAWATFKAALLCALFGHHGTVYPPEHMDRAYRICDRCDGKWERYRRAARPAEAEGETGQ